MGLDPNHLMSDCAKNIFICYDKTQILTVTLTDTSTLCVNRALIHWTRLQEDAKAINYIAYRCNRNLALCSIVEMTEISFTEIIRS